MPCRWNRPTALCACPPQLRATLHDLARKGRYVLLVVDEAHLLPSELLDQLRFLLNDEMDSASLITLVLLGQPGLAHKLRFAPYEALYQRISVRFHLKPFDLEETAGYIKHHLHIAGYRDQLFSDSFVSGVYDHTKGVARKINNLCHNALLLGATENKRVLDDSHLKRVILDLEGQVAMTPFATQLKRPFGASFCCPDPRIIQSGQPLIKQFGR